MSCTELICVPGAVRFGLKPPAAVGPRLEKNIMKGSAAETSVPEAGHWYWRSIIARDADAPTLRARR